MLNATAARSRRLSVAVVPCANLMPSMMVATLGIALPEIRRSFSLTEVEAGSLFSAALIIAALSSAIAGRLADQFGRKRILISGLTLLALGFSAAGLTHNTFLFFCFLGVTGLGYGFTPPSLYALMSDLLPANRGLGSSLVSVAYGIGGAVGAVLASKMMVLLDWRAAFLAVGGIAAADMLLQLYWIRSNPRPRSGAGASRWREAISLAIVILALAEFIGGSVFWSSAAWTPTLLRTAKALTLQQTGWVMGVLSVANMVGSFSLGSLSDKFGRKRIIILSALPAAAAAFIVFYWLDTPASLAVGMFIFGVFKASVPALVVALAQETAPSGSAGAASGIIMSLHYSAGVLAPLITARLITGTGDIVVALILATAVPMIIYGSLIATVPDPRAESLR